MKQPVVSATAHRGPRAEALPRMKSTSTAEHLLTPRMREVLERIRRAKVPAYHTLSPKEARWAYNSAAEILDLPRVPLARVQDLDIPGAGNAPLRARLYAQSHERLPVLLYLHGGGFTIGGIETHDSLCRQLAQRSGAAVVSLAYRLAPEHRFPTAVDDSFAALQWLASQAGELGLDGSRLAVGGDSAGGTLSAVCALMARDAGVELALQLLVTPGTTARQDTPSHTTFARGFLLEAEGIDWFFRHYIDDTQRDDWRFAPLNAADVDGVAPAWVGLAECDPLVDEGVAYADKLRLAGVPVQLELWRGMTHDFIKMGRAIPQALEAQASAAQALKERLFP
jgi:acetyl esterase